MRLAVLKGFHEAKDVAIESLPFIIGRCKTASFVIPNVKVSRNHCQILCDDFSWKIEDFSSSGTYINNVLVGKGKIIVLNENDVIRFGSSESNLEWTFIPLHTSNNFIERTKSYISSKFFDQSQKLMNLLFEKRSLEERIYKNNALHERQKNEEKNMNEKCQKCFKSTIIENKIERVNISAINNDHLEEKENSHQNLQNDMHRCSNETIEIEIENEKLISQLIEVQKKVEVEMAQLNTYFQVEKNKLGAEIKQKGIIIQKGSALTSKDSSYGLTEQNDLIKKINALEEAQKVLLLQLKNANTLNLKIERSNESLENNENNKNEKEKLENKIKMSNVEDSSSNVNYSFNQNNENSNLLQELEEVKNALSILEDKNSDLEGKLKEAINKENGTLKNLTDLLEAELQCTICSELFVTTITLNCTHSFCEFCLNRWKKKQKTCPICRKKIMSENRSLVIDTYIDKMVENLSVELKDRRKALIDERNEPTPVKKVKTKKRSKSYR